MIEPACLAANARRMKGGDAIADVTATTPSREVAVAIIAASGIGPCSASEICEPPRWKRFANLGSSSSIQASERGGRDRRAQACVQELGQSPSCCRRDCPGTGEAARDSPLHATILDEDHEVA